MQRESLRKFGKRLEEISKSLGKDKEKTKRLKKGLKLVEEGKWAEADKEFDAALDFLSAGEKELFLGFLFTLETMGAGFRPSKRVVNTLEYALKIHRRLGDPYLISFDIGELGLCYVKLRKYDRAIEYLLRALEMFKKMGEKRMEAEVREALGNAYMAKRELEKAKEEFQKTLELRREIPNLESEVVCYGNLGLIYIREKKYETGLRYLNKVLELQKKGGLLPDMADTHINIAHTYAKTGEHKLAAEHYAKALEIAQKFRDYRTAKNCCFWLAEEYECMGERAKAEELRRRGERMK
ncbi:MAG: tetratricopeptide repeat protein [Thermoplasmata archaeon]